MIKRTRWKPDTCSCVIDYGWSDLEPEDTRQHVDPIFESTCEKHAHIENVSDRLKAVTADNRAANPALQ